VLSLNMKVEIHRNKKGEFWVRYVGKNGKILANSETLKTKASARKNIYAMAKLFSNVFVIIDLTKPKAR
jgi:uncharacterized protein YegP (UPF0339 family)